MINNILVICLGNICRSPMAEGLLKKQCPNRTIWSAALEDLTAGWPADPSSVRVMKNHGLDISSHRAQPLSAAMLKKADLVLTMESQQNEQILYRYPQYTGKIMRIGEFGQFDVPDPYCKGMDAFERTYDLIAQGLEQIVSRIIKA